MKPHFIYGYLLWSVILIEFVSLARSISAKQNERELFIDRIKRAVVLEVDSSASSEEDSSTMKAVPKNDDNEATTTESTVTETELTTMEPVTTGIPGAPTKTVPRVKRAAEAGQDSDELLRGFPTPIRRYPVYSNYPIAIGYPYSGQNYPYPNYPYPTRTPYGYPIYFPQYPYSNPVIIWFRKALNNTTVAYPDLNPPIPTTRIPITSTQIWTFTLT